MAGHYPLNKQNEPEIFAEVEYLAELGLAYHANDLVDYEYDEFRDNKIVRLPTDYVEDKTNHIALMVGNFTLKSITDQHPSLTTNIMLEVHLMDRSVVNIFWVA